MREKKYFLTKVEHISTVLFQQTDFRMLGSLSAFVRSNICNSGIWQIYKPFKRQILLQLPNQQMRFFVLCHRAGVLHFCIVNER